MSTTTTDQRENARRHLKQALFFRPANRKRAVAEFGWAKDALYPYMVGQWGSHPDEDNDDCWTGEAFRTIEAASAAYEAASENPDMDVTHVTLIGHDVELVAEVRKPRFSRDDDRAWRSERAMQAGMLGGVGAYNDAIGSPCGEHYPED